MVGFLAVARQTDNSFRIAAGTMTMPQTDRDAGGLGRDALAEVEALHRFFEAWMGSGALDETAFERCRAALAPGFVMVGPDGALHGRDAVLQRVRTAQHAHLDADRPFRLWIEEAAVLYVEAPLCLVTYQEWQSIRGVVRGRRSSALLRRAEDAPGRVVWLHLHETWLDGGAAGPG